MAIDPGVINNLLQGFGQNAGASVPYAGAGSNSGGGVNLATLFGGNNTNSNTDGSANDPYGISQYGRDAAALYNGLNVQGGDQFSTYKQNYLGLLNRQGALAGLGNNTIQFGNPNVGAAGQRMPNQPGQQGQPGQNDPNNPYNLDQYQQQQINQTLAGLQQSHQSAVAQFQQQMQAHGINDPRALQVGQEQLNEHYADLAATEQTKFYEQVKKDKQDALASITQSLQQYGQQGIQQEEAAGSGYVGLQGGALQQKAQADQQAAQDAANHNDFLSSLLGIGGVALGKIKF